MTLDLFPDAEPSITLDFLKSKKLDPRISFSRASSGSIIGEGTGIVNNQMYEFQENVPRLTDEGLLLEGGSTNYFLNSEVGATQTVAIPSTGKWMLSFYGTGSITVSGANTGTLNGIGDDIRVYLKLTGTTIADMDLTVSGTVQYVQLEPNRDYPTSWIETTTSTVTRAADVFAMTGTNVTDWWNESEGTILFEPVHKYNATGTVYFYEITNTSRNNRHFLQDDRGCEAKKDGVEEYLFNDAPRVGAKMALGFQTDNTNVAINGDLKTLDTDCDMPTGITEMVLARNYTSGFALATGWFKRFTFYPTRVSDDSLQALTTQQT